MASSGPGGSSGANTAGQRQNVKFGYIDLSYQNGLTATAGGAQAGVSLANYSLNSFSTVGTAGDSAQLPAAVAGRMRVVQNKTATSMNVFPQTGQSIAGGANDAAFAIAANKSAMFFCIVDGNWSANLSA